MNNFTYAIYNVAQYETPVQPPQLQMIQFKELMDKMIFICSRDNFLLKAKDIKTLCRCSRESQIFYGVMKRTRACRKDIQT